MNFFARRSAARSSSALAKAWSASAEASCARADSAASFASWGSSRASAWPPRTRAPASTRRAAILPPMRNARSVSTRARSSPEYTSRVAAAPGVTVAVSTGRTGSSAWWPLPQAARTRAAAAAAKGRAAAHRALPRTAGATLPPMDPLQSARSACSTSRS